MNPFFYKCLSNNECYKIILEDDIPLSQIDACLDAIGIKNTEFIKEEEFDAKYDRLMDIDITDTTDSFKIGTLTTRYIDMSEIEDNTNINSL